MPTELLICKHTHTSRQHTSTFHSNTVTNSQIMTVFYCCQVGRLFRRRRNM